MDFRNQLDVDFDLGKLFGAFQQLLATQFELIQKGRQIQSQMGGAKALEVPPAAVIQFDRPPTIAVSKMMQADGRLN